MHAHNHSRENGKYRKCPGWERGWGWGISFRLYSHLFPLKQYIDAHETHVPPEIREMLNGIEKSSSAFLGSKNTRLLSGREKKKNFVPKNIQKHTQNLFSCPSSHPMGSTHPILDVVFPLPRPPPPARTPDRCAAHKNAAQIREAADVCGRRDPHATDQAPRG